MAKLYSSSSSWTVTNLSALELLLSELKSWLFCVSSMLHDIWLRLRTDCKTLNNLL